MLAFIFLSARLPALRCLTRHRALPVTPSVSRGVVPDKVATLIAHDFSTPFHSARNDGKRSAVEMTAKGVVPAAPRRAHPSPRASVASRGVVHDVTGAAARVPRAAAHTLFFCHFVAEFENFFRNLLKLI